MIDAKVFVDSNLFVYSVDAHEPVRQERAVEVLESLAREGRGAVSTQILGEFFNVATRRIPEPITREEAREQVKKLIEMWDVLLVTPMIVLEAARGVVEHSFSYWDAQIWATARLNEIDVVWSEDFGTGAIIEGVHFVNPLL